MGEADSTPFSFDFNGSVRVETRGSALSADAGGLLLREIDSKLHLVEDLAEGVEDPRDPELVTHPMVELLRSRIFALVLGYTDQDDLDTLRYDPILRLSVSQRRGTGPLDPAPEDEQVPEGLSSQPTQSRLVQTLSSPENLDLLDDTLAEWAVREFEELGRQGPVVLDIDSFPIEAYGSQPGSAYNGHYRMRCFHPLFTMLSGTSAVLRADLRPGNTWTADGTVGHLDRVFELAGERLGGVAAVRGDAGFVSDPILSSIEDRGVGYALRLKTNPVLERLASPYLRRPVGRPPREPREWFHELSYAADTWRHPRRVVLVVLERPGELYPDSFFLVTNYTAKEMPPEDLLEFYRARGTMERHIGEIKTVLSPTLSSSPRPKSHYRKAPPENRTPPRDGEAANAATFLLYMLAYDLMNIVRNLVADAQPATEPVPSLGRIRTTVLKATARLTRSARYARFVVNAAFRSLWQLLLERIARVDLDRVRNEVLKC